MDIPKPKTKEQPVYDFHAMSADETRATVGDMPPGTILEQSPEGETWVISFKLKGNLPVMQAQLGEWIGPVLFDTGSSKTVIDYKYSSEMSPNIRRCGNEKANGVSGSIMIEHQARVDVKAMGYTFQGIEVFLMDSVPAFRRGTFHG